MIRALAAISAAAMFGGVAVAEAADTQRGAYLATIMDCGGCHTGGALSGQPDLALRLAGSDVGFGVPGLGIFYPPNLTPDHETWVGRWTTADIVKAVRTGERPDERAQLAPVMPWRAYAALDRRRRAGARDLPQEPAAGPPTGHRRPPVPMKSRPLPISACSCRSTKPP